MKSLLFGLCIVFISRFNSDGVGGAIIELSGPICGTLTCKADEYCDQFSHGCEPCQIICDASNHNANELKCKEQCEVYLYDQRYFKKGDGSTDENLTVAVQKLQLKYTVAITLIVIVILLIIIVFFVFIWRWKTNNNVTWDSFHQKISRKKSGNNTNGVSANKVSANDQTGKKPDLRLEISANSIQSEPTPVTMTTGVTTRIPAEDSIDYAYDNPAMSNSPKKSGSTIS